MRFRVREGQVQSPRARGSRADGKGWDRLSLLSPGKLELPAEGLGVGRAGLSLAVQTPFMAETAELGRPRALHFPCALPAEFLIFIILATGEPT